MSTTHPYRTHACDELDARVVDEHVRIAGWIARQRDHGGVLFSDVRDATGSIQCVCEAGTSAFDALRTASVESSLTLSGIVRRRAPEHGEGFELVVHRASVLGACAALPFGIDEDLEVNEDLRLRHRYLDLRRSPMRRNLELRANVMTRLRAELGARDFTEVQTPILAASSPEGARDYLVPSRLVPGHVFALPQAPQVYKQILMASGIERYFQIAPCFRDEDARADRSPGEFYQLDLEMAFVTQDEVFANVEGILEPVLREFYPGSVASAPWPRIPHATALREFGSDKPDLRNPLRIVDVTPWCRESDACARAIRVPGQARSQSRRALGRSADERRASFAVCTPEGLAGPLARHLDARAQRELRSPLRARTRRRAVGRARIGDRSERSPGRPAHRVGRRSGPDRTRPTRPVLDRRLPDVRAHARRRAHVQPQPLLDAPGRDRSARDGRPHGSARAPVRPGLQRGGAVQRRAAQPHRRRRAARVRAVRLRPRGDRAELPGAARGATPRPPRPTAASLRVWTGCSCCSRKPRASAR